MSEITNEQKRARNILFFAFASLWLLDLAFVLVSSGGITGYIRLLLTAILMYFVLNGHKWAKWLMVILSALAILVYSFGSILLFGQNKALASIFVIISIALLILVIYLVFDKNVNSYLEAAKKKQ